MKVALLPLDDLHPHPDNPRRAGPGAVDTLVQLITTHGWTQPIVASRRRSGKYVILVGHHRHKAALKIRHQRLAIPDHPDTNLAPVQIHEGLTPKKEMALMTSDNIRKTAWDGDKLKKALSKIGKVYAGFGASDVNRILNANSAAVNFADITRKATKRTMTCTLTNPKKAAALAEYLRENKIPFWQWTE